MNLKNTSILVDGYNLELPKGTGIKTYGISLVRALQKLSAEVNILYSVPLRQKAAANSFEEFFFKPTLKTELKYLDYYVGYLLKSLFNISLTAKQLSLTDTFWCDRAAKANNYQNASERQLSECANLYLPLCYRLANQSFKKCGLQLKITAPKKIDIWHATYPLPIEIIGAKKITTIHDLIPLRLPSTTLDNKKFFYRLIKNAIETSDLIITISENTKQDLVEICKCPADKIEITYQPVAIESSNKTEAEITNYLQSYNLKPNNYILFVGAIEPKKNLGRLIDAYKMSATNMPLVIVGKKGWLWEQDLAKLDDVAKSPTDISKQALVLDFVSDRDLEYLYRGAYCLVFPSLYEGFGLPVLEAMSFGCPIITSHTASLPEICGDAALYVNPYNTDDIADKIDCLTQDPVLRTYLSKAGKSRAEFFSMENYLTSLSSAYQRLLK